MVCSTSNFLVLHYILEFEQPHVHWVDDGIQPSHPLSSPSPPALNPSQQSASFPMSWLFPSGNQNTAASDSASVLPMNIQDWFPWGLTSLISLLSKGLSRVFSSTTIQNHQFCFLTCIRFLRRQGRWSGILISGIFHSVVIHIVKGFSIVSEAE